VTPLDQYVGTISSSPGAGSLSGLTPVPFPLPNAFHGVAALVGAEFLQWRSRLAAEPFIAAGAVATIVEKNLE
jgi:hypothetical protein